MDDTGGSNGDRTAPTTSIISCRYDRVADVDAAAKAAGMPRSAWLAWTVDRGLAGIGVFSADEITERRQARLRRSEQVKPRPATRDAALGSS